MLMFDRMMIIWYLICTSIINVTGMMFLYSLVRNILLAYFIYIRVTV